MREGKKEGKHQVRISGKVAIMRRKIRTFWQRVGYVCMKRLRREKNRKKGSVSDV